MDFRTTETHGCGGEFTVGQARMETNGRKYRWEGDGWREYLYGRRVITREEMRQMDCPLPPEDPEDL